MISKILPAIALTLALYGGAGAAWAQTGSATAASAEPSAERLRLARAVFQAQGGEDNMRAVLQRATAGMTEAMTRQGAQANDATVNAFRKAAAEVMQDLVPKILNLQIRIYAETFDDRQLSDILAFYQSPTGQVMRAKLPEIASKAAVQVAALTPTIQLQIVEKVCAETACTAAEQRMITQLKQRAAAGTAP